MAAISPAIVVPTTLILQEKGYGVVKGESFSVMNN